jgi:hypothetical protein
MSDFRLRFDPALIPGYARRYSFGDDEIAGIGPRVKRRGFLTKRDLRILGKWKSARSAHLLERNSEEFVEETTEIALRAKSEQLRIGSLLLLSGVNWGLGSVILHTCHLDPYPILDWRALWSLSTRPPSFPTFDVWWHYTQFCRELAVQNGVTMRDLDRALWQYSKEHQR